MARKNYTHEELLDLCLGALLDLQYDGIMATGQAVARRLDRNPAQHINDALFELSEQGYVICTPHAWRGAVSVRWEFELTREGIWNANSLLGRAQK